MVSDIMIATTLTTAIGHTALKEFEVEVERYNRAARGYYYRMLPNLEIFLNKSLWYCNGCLIRLRKRTYYCKHNFLE